MLSKSLFLTVLPMAMAFIAGAVLPFQSTSNAAIGRALGHPLWAALTSLLISAIVVIATLLVLKVQAPDIGRALRGAWWVWVGGVLGAIYITSAAIVTPKLGASGFVVLVVAGQVVASLLMDHFGLLGLAHKPLTLLKLIGVGLILGGVFLVQSPSANAAAKSPTPCSAQPSQEKLVHRA
jgi:bacterial/archaeal transporter family-2 protein